MIEQQRRQRFSNEAELLKYLSKATTFNNSNRKKNKDYVPDRFVFN